jgi:hypothetical protein
VAESKGSDHHKAPHEEPPTAAGVSPASASSQPVRAGSLWKVGIVTPDGAGQTSGGGTGATSWAPPCDE